MMIDIRSKHLSQSQLTTLVPKESLFGIKALSKIAFLCFSLLLIIILGMVTGLFGGKILTDICFDFQGLSYLSICFLTVILIGSVSLIHRGILATLVQSVGVSFVWVPLTCLVLLQMGWLQNLGYKILAGILLNALYCGFIVLSTVVFALLLQLWSQMLPKQYLVIQGVLIVILGAIATGLASQLSHASALDNTTLETFRQTLDPPIGSVEAAVLGGLVWTMIVVLSGVRLSDAMTQFYPRFLWLRQACTAIASWGGTSFYNLDLSSINFSGANIANSDFRGKVICRACLIGMQGLDRARVDSRYLDLDQRRVQKLLTTGIAVEQDFQRVNLQGAFLQNANLRDTNFNEAILHGADLQRANLRGALLAHARVTNVNFSGADLTGCCIQDWSTNRYTDFTGVICAYIYREFEAGQARDRYPRDRDFQAGEFAALQRQVDNSVELVFQGTTNLRVLDFTLEQFKLEDNGLGLELQGIEQRGDLYVVKVSYRDGISPQQVKQKVYNTFNVFLQGDSATAYNVVQQIGDNIMESQIISPGGISAGGNVDASSGARVSVGGDVTGSTINLGTISGNVTNLIQQVRDSSIQGSQDLAQILGDLHKGIEIESGLSDPQKQEALEAVGTLAEEAKKPPENRIVKLCSMAMNALKGVTSSLSDASKLSEVIKTSLPLLKGLFGLA